MRVASNAAVRKMSDLTVGELIFFGDEKQEIGIVIATGQKNAEPLIGVLKSAEEPHPRLLRPWGEDACLSFGDSWVIEPLVDGDIVPNNIGSRRAGWLCLTSSGWAMSFASSSIDQIGRFSLEWWKFGDEGGAINTPGRGSVGFAKWRIWADEESRLSLRGKPLFEHEAKAPTPR